MLLLLLLLLLLIFCELTIQEFGLSPRFFFSYILCVVHVSLFLWCVISWFYFPWNMNLRNSVFFVIRDLKALRDPWCNWIINRYSWFYYSVLRDSEMRVLQMVKVVWREWLRYVICNMEPWLTLSPFYCLQALFLVIRENEIFHIFLIGDPLFFPFVNRARYLPLRPSKMVVVSIVSQLSRSVCR